MLISMDTAISISANIIHWLFFTVIDSPKEYEYGTNLDFGHPFTPLSWVLTRIFFSSIAQYSCEWYLPFHKS